MRRHAVYLLVATILPSAAFADIVIQTRSTEYRSSHSYPPGPPPPWGPQDFNDFASVNQLGQIGSGSVDLFTFHNEHFTSTASSSLISAAMRGSRGWGQINYRDRWTTSSWFAVEFEVTQSDNQVTIDIDGTIFPHMDGTAGPITGFTLAITNMASGQTVFDVAHDTPPEITFGLGHVDWDHASWSGTLAPGMYMLISQARAETTYGSGGGSGESGSTYVTFAVNFGPAASPATAPAPSTAAGLTMLVLAAARRRR
jgi:hypothetical protein